MSNKNRHSIPFDSEDFDFSKFESFMSSLLSLSEELPIGEKKSLIHTSKTVNRYGKQGDKQFGIDILAQLDGGQRLVVQCKYHDPSAKIGRVTLTEAKNAIKKAEKEYPKAKHYILATNIEHNHPDTIEHIAELENWTLWGKQQFHELIRQLPLSKAWHLIVDHFGLSVAWEFFPLGPAILLQPEEYHELGTGTLSHQYSCVGRNSELKAIKSNLLKNKAQAVIVSGEGGIGKSRIFIEALTQLKAENPEHQVLIAEPDNGGNWKHLSLLPESHLIIGLDDCHLDARLSNEFLILANQRPDTKLLLMTRPGGVDQVKEKLRRTGWEKAISQPFNKKPLAPLKVTAMEQLAREIIGYDHQDIPELVKLSNGNALFVVIASEKLRDNNCRITQILHDSSFQEAIFETLSDQITLHQEKKKRSLQNATCLALLSPFKIADYPDIAKLLELSEFELDEEIHRLRHLGLIRLGSDTGRIIPDLFSDHLIKSLFTSKTTPLLRRLTRSPLFDHNNTSVFKNLALLQWHQQQEDPLAPSITEPLWKGFKEDYKSRNDSQRQDMLTSWKIFGLYLPNETLSLCQTALKIPSNFPDNPYHDNDRMRDFYKSQIQAEVVALLKALAEYHPDQQAEALEILWDLMSNNDHSLKHRGREVFSEILSFKSRRFPLSLESALTWLAHKLQEPNTWKQITEHSSHLVDVLFRNLFAPSIEKNNWEANSVQIWNEPVHIENTATFRKNAFELIEKIALYSPIGAKNCLSILSKITSRPRIGIGGTLSGSFETKWLSVRQQALDIMEKIAINSDSQIIHFLLRKNLKSLLRFAIPTEIDDSINNILNIIGTSSGLQKLIILLSYEHTEFYKKSRTEDREVQRLEQRRQWEDLTKDVAQNLITELQTPTQIAHWCDETTVDLAPFGMNPNFHSIFEALNDINPDITDSLRRHILDHPQCSFAHSYAQLSFWLQPDPEFQDLHLSQGVLIDRPNVLYNILNVLQYRSDDNPLNKTKTATKNLLLDLDANGIDQFIKILNDVSTKEFGELIFLNLPWEKFEKRHFSWLGQRFDEYHGANLFDSFPSQALQSILNRLQELPADSIQEIRALVRHACLAEPKMAFEFFDHRIKEAIKNKETENIFPITLDGFRFGNLSKVPDLHERVNQVYQLSQNDPDNSRLWNEWLSYILAHQGDLEETMLKQQASNLHHFDQTIQFTKALSAYQIFGYPDIINTLLENAQPLPAWQQKQIADEIFYQVIRHGQSYENGIPQDTWHLEQARKLSQIHTHKPLLKALYERIVQSEEADAERHRRAYEKDISSFNEFH